MLIREVDAKHMRRCKRCKLPAVPKLSKEAYCNVCMGELTTDVDGYPVWNGVLDAKRT